MPAATTTQLGKGTVLSYSTDNSTPHVYTPLTRVMSINPTNTVGEVEDVTLDSTFESYLPTITAAECTFTIRDRPGDPGVILIQGWITTPTVIHWKITLPDGSSITFDGFIKGYSKTYENKTIVDAEVPMRITSVPVYTQAA